MSLEVSVTNLFYGSPDVAEVGNRAIGLWIRLASYHACFPDYDIPWVVAKMCDGTKQDVLLLMEVGLLVNGERGWQLGSTDRELWKLTSPPSSRIPRPTIAAQVRAEVMERDEYTCLHCGATEDLSLDHIIPYSHGGPDTVENLRVLCRRCNSVRGNRVEADA